MSESFTKLFGSILASTVWQEPDATRLTWITMLAMADKDGVVKASVPGLAHLARVTLKDCEVAIATFLSPDPYSRTADHEGRRIEVSPDGGWRLLNHAAYRAARDPDSRRDYQREWDRNNRRRNPTESDTSDQIRPETTHTDTDTDTEVDKSKSRRSRESVGSRLPADWSLPTEWETWARSERKDIDPKMESLRFADYWHAQPGTKGRKSDWQATWRNWIRNARTAFGVHVNGHRPNAQPMHLPELTSDD